MECRSLKINQPKLRIVAHDRLQQVMAVKSKTDEDHFLLISE